MVQLHLLKPFLPFPAAVDQTRQFHGWRELGEQVSRVVDQRPSDRGYFLVSDKGTTAAEAVFYSGARLTGFDLFQPERYVFLGDLSDPAGKGRRPCASRRKRCRPETIPWVFRLDRAGGFPRLRLPGREDRGAQCSTLHRAGFPGELERLRRQVTEKKWLAVYDSLPWSLHFCLCCLFPHSSTPALLFLPRSGYLRTRNVQE